MVAVLIKTGQSKSDSIRYLLRHKRLQHRFERLTADFLDFLDTSLVNFIVLQEFGVLYQLGVGLFVHLALASDEWKTHEYVGSRDILATKILSSVRR